MALALEVQGGASPGGCDPSRHVQQRVAQPLGFDLGHVAVEDQALGEGDQVLGP